MRLRWSLLLPLGLLLFVQLGERPLHHDEGVNGWFLDKLVTSGEYRYDPSNYHGPTLYYLQLGPTALAWLAGGGHGPLAEGLSEVSLRTGVAAAALLALGLLLGAADLLGRWGSLAAAALLGTSGSALFFERDFIHETWLLLFTLLALLAGLRFRRQQRFGQAALAVAAATLALCTKETFPLTVIALALGWLGAEWFGPQAAPGLHTLRAALGPLGALNRRQVGLLALLAAAIFVTLFSSFFTVPRGPLDAVRAFLPWGHEAVHSVHEKPAGYYLFDILAPYEPALLLGGLLGLLVAARRRDRLGLGLGIWALAILGLYSAIPYKTPWLVLNLVLPLALAAGRGVELLVGAAAPGSVRRGLALAALALVAGLWLASMPKAYRLVFREWDDPRHPQVYAQTVRQFRRLVADLEVEATKRGGPKTAMEVTAPSYWPLPFYLRRYSAVAYWGGLETARLDAPLVVASGEQQPELAKRLTSYSMARYDLRPGVELDLWQLSVAAAPPGPAAQ